MNLYYLASNVFLSSCSRVILSCDINAQDVLIDIYNESFKK